MARTGLFLSPAPGSPPNPASRISAHPVACGQRTSRFPLTPTWRAARCVAKPGVAAGRGHLALASLYRAGKVPELVTQNIDNLHQASGIAPQHVVELHGNTTYAVCLDCGKRYELTWIRREFEVSGRQAPDCNCGGIIKTATVSFGQSMPADAMQRAEQLAKSCDLFLAVGSSLVVWPAAGFPLMAKRNGAILVIINRESTEFDDLADLVVRNDIGDALAPFVSH
jgi:NAD-dependent deacetylase